MSRIRAISTGVVDGNRGTLVPDEHSLVSVGKTLVPDIDKLFPFTFRNMYDTNRIFRRYTRFSTVIKKRIPRLKKKRRKTFWFILSYLVRIRSNVLNFCKINIPLNRIRYILCTSIIIEIINIIIYIFIVFSVLAILA